MNTARVSLRSTLKSQPPAELGSNSSALPLLDRDGPSVRLSGAAAVDGLAMPVKPDAATLFGPRGACLIAEGGPLWVSDTGHHRILGWAKVPEVDDAPADWIIGQPDFSREGRNAKGEPSAITLNVPTGITGCGEGLAVADAWNHRILIWHALPTASNVPADVVLGQLDFNAVESNRGSDTPTASTLFWPYGVHWDGERLWVADSENRRVLMWNGVPQRNGQAADLILGQASFDCRNENGGGEPSASSMRWPHAITLWRGRLCVADAGNNRIMVWNAIPQRNNAACDVMLGQSNMQSVDNNQSLYWPNAAALNMPYGCTSAGDWLISADTANSRIVGWHIDDCHIGAEARALSAQVDFRAKGDNRWQPPARDSVSWPYGITACGRHMVVADSGNSRVLLWDLAPECSM